MHKIILKSFDFKIFNKLTYSCLIRVFFIFLNSSYFIQIKKSQTSIKFIQIILSSNIEIIEGNQINFVGLHPPPPKKTTKRMRHGNVGKLTYNSFGFVTLLQGLIHPKAFTHTICTNIKKKFGENCAWPLKAYLIILIKYFRKL